jgi:hypothetical protein
MKSLDESYRAYLDKRRRDADKALADKGLEPVGLNHLRYDLVKLPPLVDKDVFAVALVEVKEEQFKALKKATAPHIAKSLAYSKTQTARAKKPRGKLDENKTIGEIIARLVHNNPGETAKELWQQFIGQLTADGLEPRESKSEPLLVVYEGPKGQKKMAFRTFENKVSKIKIN